MCGNLQVVAVKVPRAVGALQLKSVERPPRPLRDQRFQCIDGTPFWNGETIPDKAVGNVHVYVHCRKGNRNGNFNV